MNRRKLVVTLPGDWYLTLEAMAEREERAPDQQASLLLRRALQAAENEVASIRPTVEVCR